VIMDGPRKVDTKIDDLLVNPDNYRFDPVENQRDAMLIMLKSQKDKVLNLARDIAQHGLSPMERLAVKEAEGGKYISLEGNRRLTVLKLMVNPDELSGDYPYRGVFEELNARYRDTLPTVVECAVFGADEQEAADRWVNLKHTGENQGVGTVPWNSYQKRRFELRHKREQSTTLQIADLLEGNGVDITGILATNLERLFTTPQVRHALGFDFTKKQLTLLEPEAEVVQKLKKVVERMQAKGFSVGEIYKVEDRLNWIQDVLGLQPAPATQPADIIQPPLLDHNGSTNAPTTQPAPPPSSNGSTNTQQSPAAGAGTSTLAPPQPVPTPTPPNPPAPSAPSVYYMLVNPTKVLPQTISGKIRIIYKELQTVHVTGSRQAPHAVAALLRILIEITAQEYLIKKQGFNYYGQDFRQTPAGTSYNELKQKLAFIASHCGLPNNIAQVLKTLQGRQLMTAELNQVMHNTIFTADAAAIKGIWQNFESVFDYLIGEMQ
jgi:hypothetical protein